MDNESRLSIIIQDCEEMSHILAEFCDTVLASELAEGQQDRTRRKESKEWTFHQTLAHVTAAAEFYQQALETTLSGAIFSPRMQQRSDLSSINEHEIAARQHMTRRALTQDLLRAFKHTTQRVQTLTPEALTQQVNVPLFNRPLTIAEVLDMQLVHPGILHAAQLTNAVGMK